MIILRLFVKAFFFFLFNIHVGHYIYMLWLYGHQFFVWFKVTFESQLIQRTHCKESYVTVKYRFFYYREKVAYNSA